MRCITTYFIGCFLSWGMFHTINRKYKIEVIRDPVTKKIVASPYFDTIPKKSKADSLLHSNNNDFLFNFEPNE